MKDSHNDMLLDELRKRLAKYEEPPDAGVWDGVYAGVHSPSGGLWVPAVTRLGTVIALLFLSLSLLPENQDNGEGIGRAGSRSASSESQSQDTSKTDLLMPSTANLPRALSTPGALRVSPGNTIALSDDSPLPPANDAVPISTDMTHYPESQEALMVSTSDSSANSVKDLKTDSALVADSREEPVPSRLKRSLVFYAGLSGSLAFQKITPFGNDGIGVQSFRPRPVFSQERLGISLQAGVQTRIFRRLELYSGITLYTQSLRLIYDYRSDDMVVDQDNMFEYSIGPGTTRNSVEYSMLNAGVEAGFIYYLTGDRLLHKFGSGLAWQHGFKSTSEDKSYDNARSHYLHYQLFYRNELIVNNKTNVFIQPFYRHALISREHLSAPFMVKPYYAGLTFGVVYRPD